MTDAVDPLDLSDEDFAELSDSEVEALFAEAESESDEDTSDESTTDVADNEEDLETTEDNSEEESNDENLDEEDSNEESNNSSDELSNNSEENTDELQNEEEEPNEEEEEEVDNTDSSDEIDYKAFYEASTAPFQANGKEMQVDNVEDQIKLMQMGANYNKKMAAIKPSLKLIKMLENNKLLDEDNISYLIDLSKKDPTAINKLLKDSDINPLELDLEQEHGYETNQTYTVSDNEVNLDGILEEIRDTESFAQTIDIVSNKWDEKSKQVLLDNPEVIKTINGHVEAGIYDRITQVVDREKMLGKLDGMSDLEAYKYVGDAINEAGGFDSTGEDNQNLNIETTNKKVDPNIKARKKAASSTKTTVTKNKAIESYDPLSMSDEEIEKLAASGLF